MVINKYENGDKVKTDILKFDIPIEVKQEYKNISKHKRRLFPVVSWNIGVFINEVQLYKDEVFVPDIFFDILENEGKFPMFTCTCGIFECGGYYVEVYHHKEEVTWITEKEYIEDDSKSKFLFSWENIISVADILIQRLDEINSTLTQNGYEACFETEKFKKTVEERKRLLID